MQDTIYGEKGTLHDEQWLVSLNINQSSCTNSVSEDDLYLSLYASLELPHLIWLSASESIVLTPFPFNLFYKTTRNKFMSKSIDWLES